MAYIKPQRFLNAMMINCSPFLLRRYYDVIVKEKKNETENVSVILLVVMFWHSNIFVISFIQLVTLNVGWTHYEHYEPFE